MRPPANPRESMPTLGHLQLLPSCIAPFAETTIKVGEHGGRYGWEEVDRIVSQATLAGGKGYAVWNLGHMPGPPPHIPDMRFALTERATSPLDADSWGPLPTLVGCVTVDAETAQACVNLEDDIVHELQLFANYWNGQCYMAVQEKQTTMGTWERDSVGYGYSVDEALALAQQQVAQTPAEWEKYGRSLDSVPWHRDLAFSV